MDLSHEEKIIAMKGFSDSIEKKALWSGGLKTLSRLVTKTKGLSDELGSKGKALYAGATGKGVSSARRTPAGVTAGHTSQQQKALYNKGKKVYENRGKILAGTGVGGTALVMKD